MDPKHQHYNYALKLAVSTRCERTSMSISKIKSGDVEIESCSSSHKSTVITTSLRSCRFALAAFNDRESQVGNMASWTFSNFAPNLWYMASGDRCSVKFVSRFNCNAPISSTSMGFELSHGSCGSRTRPICKSGQGHVDEWFALI